jgi:SHS2 domain-containing protein
MSRREYDFEFVDDVAIADAAFRARGADLAELFGACAAAIFATITDLQLINPVMSRKVRLSAADRETLLFDWLAELVYLKDVNRELYCSFNIDIETDGEMRLLAEVAGEAMNNVRHNMRTDVKAVTYHRLKIEDTASGLEAFVVLDL